jgi:SAM-dependent methyltransferase
MANEPGAYWEKRLNEHWGPQGVGHIALGERYNRWLYLLQKKVFLRHARRLAAGPARPAVLDIGSGTGFYVGLWKEAGAGSLTASDITQTAVRNLRQKFPDVECLLLDIGAPLAEEFAGRSYDRISAFAVLYHITDDERYARAIANMYRLLKPGGTLVISENFVHGAASRHPFQVNRSLAEITRLLEGTGFHIRKRRPMFVLMNYPVDSRSRLRLLFWRGLTASIRRFPALGSLWGMLLYPLDRFLSLLLREGASTELMVCGK